MTTPEDHSSLEQMTPLTVRIGGSHPTVREGFRYCPVKEWFGID